MNAAFIRIKHYYFLFMTLKPKGIWVLAKKSVHDFFRGAKARWAGTYISEREFRLALVPEFAQPEAFLEHIKKRAAPRFFIDTTQKDGILAAVRQVCPISESITIKAADEICRHRFDLLGSGPLDLGSSIDWHADFKTGFRWKVRQYYTGIRTARYPGGYDIKVPWEMSRCQHFAWLGQAYWFTGEEKYAREFCSQVESWIEHNPPQFGVNWACSMDVAIRAVNWLWGYAFFKDSQALDDAFRLSFFKCLLSHGRHIRANLENSGAFTGNHYLADIVGLVYLGILLPEYQEAREWQEFGLKELETEMFKQVYPDGGNFEASTSYHRLVTEMFLSATLLAKLNGHPFTVSYMQRLEKMLDFICRITKPDGTAPLIGDQDNGRLQRLKAWDEPEREWSDFRVLLAVGAVLFERANLARAAGEQWEEALWLYGTDVLPFYTNTRSAGSTGNDKSSAGFPDMGLYISHKDDLYLIADLGTNGQNGKGGHAHNDTLSFEFFASGQAWIQDPGTYTYTFDYQARNLFRSTAYHNTVRLPDYEQNSFHSQQLFEMENESRPRLLSWQMQDDYDYLAGEISRGKPPALTTHKRSFFIDRKEDVVMIRDQVITAKTPAQLYLHFAPGLAVELIDSPYLGLKLSNATGDVLRIFSLAPEKAILRIQTGWISTSYGRRETAAIAVLEWPTDSEHTLALIPEKRNTDFMQRLENIIIHSKEARSGDSHLWQTKPT